MAMIRYIFMVCLIFQVFAEKCPNPHMIRLLGEPYLLKSVFVNDKKNLQPPQYILTSEGEILYNTNNQSHSLKKNLNDVKLKFHIPMKARKEYVYPSGEDITIENGKIQLYSQSRRKVIHLATKSNYYAHNMAVDSDQNRVFFLCFPQSNNANSLGKVFVYDKEGMNVVGGLTHLEEVTDLGHNVTAIAVDRGSGNLLMSVMDDVDGTKFWSFKMLEKIDKTPQRKEDTSGFNKKALESAIRQAGKEIIKLYEEAVMGGNLKEAEIPVNEVMECNDKLQKSDENVSKLLGNITNIRNYITSINSTLNNLPLDIVTPKFVEKLAVVFKFTDLISDATEVIKEINVEVADD